MSKDKKLSPAEEEKAAKKGIREMYEKARKEQEKLVSSQERRYGE